MVQPRKQPGDTMNGSGKTSSMSFQRKDGNDSRASGSSARGDGKAQNGTRSGFRTDTAISNNRPGAERPLQRWVPDAPADIDGSLEQPSSNAGGGWDQFAENERLFGVKTNYHENYYTTAIDKSHPQYNERLAAADKKAREIEKSVATTSHVAEERVMDSAPGEDQGEDEEDKYSGVRRQQEFPPLTATRGDNKYTPPARRAPTGHTTVTGAPVDPAIISSQIKVVPNRKQGQAKNDEAKSPTTNSKTTPAVAVPQIKTPEPKADAKTSDKQPEAKPAEAKTPSGAKQADPNTATDGKVAPGSSSTLRATATPGRGALSPGSKPTTSTTSSSTTNSPAPPSVTDNVENALLKDFKDFASQQRLHAEKARHNKMKADAQVKLQELRKFATSFKLSTPVPVDLISIIAKDPAKQKQIQEKALQNAEELKTKSTETKTKDTASSVTSAATTSAKTAATAATSTATPTTGPATGASANTSSAAPTGASAGSSSDKPANARQGAVHNTHNSTPGGVPNRHPNSRQPYMQQGYRQQSQPYRGDRAGAQHMPQGHTGNLADRIRNEQGRYAKGQASHAQQHFNHPPTGPASSVDPNYARRLSAVPPGAHMAQKLNPTTHEFRPSPFAASFNPTGPSTGSSPRSTVNTMNALPDSTHATATASTAPTIVTASSPRNASSLIRRKVKAVSAKKCVVFDHVKTIKPPQGRNWDDNDGLRPSYDTQPIWRQYLEDEKEDSTMRLTYKAFFERMAFGAAAMATPIQGHALPHGLPQMGHHQLPLHMQHGGHMGPRPSPHMPPVAMHTGGNGPHGHAPHGSFNGGDDHRMMHSQSAQSYASPRLASVPVYPHQVGGTPQMAYNQPVMQQFIPGAPQMGQYRNFSNGPQQYMPPQSGPIMSMMPPQQPFMGVPGGLPVYPQFMAPPGTPGGVAPQQMGGANGYPSPGRPAAAPMMVQQGSQQGQPMYGMSPSMQYQQPAFGPQHPGQGVPMRGGYNNPGAQQFGTSPQHVHQYGPPHRNGSGNYGGKNYQNHNHNSHQGPPPHQANHNGPIATNQQGRSGVDGIEEAK